MVLWSPGRHSMASVSLPSSSTHFLGLHAERAWIQQQMLRKNFSYASDHFTRLVSSMILSWSPLFFSTFWHLGCRSTRNVGIHYQRDSILRPWMERNERGAVERGDKYVIVTILGAWPY
jgi:hypothetical protein